jgi:hypothetical protein
MIMREAVSPAWNNCTQPTCIGAPKSIAIQTSHAPESMELWLVGRHIPPARPRHADEKPVCSSMPGAPLNAFRGPWMLNSWHSDAMSHAKPVEVAALGLF